MKFKKKKSSGFAGRVRRVLALSLAMLAGIIGLLLLDARAGKEEMRAVCAKAAPGTPVFRLIEDFKENSHKFITAGDGRVQHLQVRSARGFGRLHCNITHNGNTVISASMNFTR
ncbi:hypothetical protein EPN18_08990 [bacterium]|nr:MAG: hypothetical protein EPN18_08990 [bacterium]